MGNEFVMVPRKELQRLQESMDPHRGAVAWGIVCDLLEKPAAQQGEPVAFVRFRNGEPDYDGDACMIMNVRGDTLGDGDSWEPVYTHADSGEVDQHIARRMEMAGQKTELYREVERLREQCERRRVRGLACANKVATLRAQLAEAHALLREALPALDLAAGAFKSAKPVRNKIKAALSASAEPSAMAERIKSAACPECASKPCMCKEPSAPAEIDERAEFEAWGADQGYFNLRREHSGKYKFQTAWAAWEGWQARAALERKPSESVHICMACMMQDGRPHSEKHCTLAKPSDTCREAIQKLRKTICLPESVEKMLDQALKGERP